MENNTTLQQQLLEAGVHFGHLRKKWNPKMLPYIYAEKKGIQFAVLVGEEEIKQNQYKIKDLVSGEQETVSFDQLIEKLKSPKKMTDLDVLLNDENYDSFYSLFDSVMMKNHVLEA